MKKYILILIVLFISCFIKVPMYLELNNLKIIQSIKVDCTSNTYYLKEIIPSKSDNGIQYNKITHKLKYNQIKNNNKLFLRDVYSFTSNCSNDKEIIKKLKIHPKKIIYKKNIIF